LEICEARDVKGLYKKARSGDLKDFTGINGGYEPPSNPDIEIKTVGHKVDDCVGVIYEYLLKLITYKNT